MNLLLYAQLHETESFRAVSDSIFSEELKDQHASAELKQPPLGRIPADEIRHQAAFTSRIHGKWLFLSRPGDLDERRRTRQGPAGSAGR